MTVLRELQAHLRAWTRASIRASLSAMTAVAKPRPPPRPTLRELLERCDLARLHPDRLEERLRRWKLVPEPEEDPK